MNPRVVSAFNAMKEIGIPAEAVKPVLENLLISYDKNWEFIEAENYRALADAIFESKDDKVFRTNEVEGWGLQAMEDLPEGAVVCECVGEILTNIESHERNHQQTGKEMHTYPVQRDADWASDRKYSEGRGSTLPGCRHIKF